MAQVRSDIYRPLLLAVGILLCGVGSQARAQGIGPEMVPGPGPGGGVSSPLPGGPPPRGPEPAPTVPGAVETTPSESEVVADVRIEGNKSIRLDRITPNIRIRPGRTFSLNTVQEDVRRLMKSRQFVDVRVEYPRGPNGELVVLFQVIERPTIEYIKYVGNEKLKLKILNRESGLKIGESLDPYTVEEARRKLEEFYRKRGFSKIRINIIEGDKLGDRGVIMVINEGYIQRVSKVEFIGNTIATDARLKTQINSRPPILWIFKGYVEREKIDEDLEKLTAYYRSLGFFRARIGRELDWNEKGNWLTLRFVIDEGPRYKLRNISVNGNKIFQTNDLIGQLDLEPGDYFDQPKMTKDMLTLQDNYGAHGYVFAEVKADPRFLEEPGMLDLVYNITEGDRYRVGKIEVDIEGDHPHSKISTVLNRISLRPGDIVDVRELRASERRLKASGLFMVDPQRGVAPTISMTPMDPKTGLAAGPEQSIRGQSPEEPEEREITIGVGGRLDPNPRPVAEPNQLQQYPRLPPPPLQPAYSRPFNNPGQANPGTSYRAQPTHVPPGAAPQRPGTSRLPWPSDAIPRPDQTQKLIPVPPSGKLHIPRPPGSETHTDFQAAGFVAANFGNPNAQAERFNAYKPGVVVRGQYSPSDAGTGAASPNPTVNQPGFAQPQFNAPPIPNTPAPRAIPQNQPVQGGVGQQVEIVPGGPDPSIAPDGILPELPPNEIMPPGGYIDDKTLILRSTVQETQTGRFMFGVGVNSDAGLVGSIVLEEQNFDITRVPTSWAELVSGTAFRGAGQQFRIDAVPGNQVQRYSFSFREPYLFNTPISFGISAFLFTRIYNDWNEERLGGRINLGYMIRPDVSVTAAVSGQNVNVSDPRIPTPPEIEEVLGNNDLYLARVGLVHDTRDSAFLPTQGFYHEVGLEQGFGQFTFPRATLEARHYFLIHERPDGSGRHVLSARGQLGFTGNNTPVFENFFAGGFSTLRGFSFRGASPVNMGSQVGGEFQLLGGFEYLFPLTADDALRAVVFVDYGTVEERVAIDWNNFRVSPGAGLRISVPGMGPAPIALDLAFPVAMADTDDKQIFSFFVGFLR